MILSGQEASLKRPGSLPLRLQGHRLERVEE
jgi:hypothetical protein